jgi:molybdenum cofactor cytidylyltransferase
LQPLAGGDAVAVRSARVLLSELEDVVAVVRPGADDLAQQLAKLGCQVVVCGNAADGMAASLVCGLQRRPDSAGWLIALADMPFLRPASIAAVCRALQDGASIVAPIYQGRRGHPVAFAHRYLPQLLALRGDQGARSLLQNNPVTEVEVGDPGIHRDIDLPADLD